MAKFSQGILGPFSGKVGTVVGYMWNGKCCMRAYNRTIKNPRTPEQVAHRNMFKQEVQLAAEMRWVLNTTMRDQAREMGMTCRNLFMKANQHAFGLEEGLLQVDYSRLVLSMGDVPGVEATETSWSADNVLTVKFDRGMGNAYHHVYLYLHVPDLSDPDNPVKGFLAAPVYRRDKRISVALPDAFAGHTAHLYLMVQTDDGHWSETSYAGSLLLEPHPLTPSPRGEGESLTSQSPLLTRKALPVSPLDSLLNGEGERLTSLSPSQFLPHAGTPPM
jgi:hypothetical protein